MTQRFLRDPALAAVATVAVLAAAVAPALAMTPAEFEAARGRYELSDGRVAHLGGSARRPSVVIGAGPALALAAARDHGLASPDGRLELRFDVQPNGVVTGVRVTQRP
jgi:outer membrane biosynthesis protein TonB